MAKNPFKCSSGPCKKSRAKRKSKLDRESSVKKSNSLTSNDELYLRQTILKRTVHDIDPVAHFRREEQAKLRAKCQKKRRHPTAPCPGPSPSRTIITPSVHTRIEASSRPTTPLLPGEKPKLAYIHSKTKVVRPRDKYEIIRLASLSRCTKSTEEFKIASPNVSKAGGKVMPRVPSISPDAGWPKAQTKAHLKGKTMGSRIFINETNPPGDEDTIDSFGQEYIERMKQREAAEREMRVINAGEDTDMEQEGGYSHAAGRRQGSRSSKSRSEGSRTQGSSSADDMDEEEGEGEESEMESSEYENVEVETVNKLVQKFRRKSEEDMLQVRKCPAPFTRGTLQSHSFAKLHQDMAKELYCGVRIGTMHLGVDHFPEHVRGRQAPAMCVAAYAFSFLRHPKMWSSNDIDQILESGNNLFVESLDQQHVHDSGRELAITDLVRHVCFGQAKVQYHALEPDVMGRTRSDDKTVFHLSKGLSVFFKANRAGVLQVPGLCVAIWRQRYYYMFDPMPRLRDLVPDRSGFAMLMCLYDLKAVVTVLLDRSRLKDKPFFINKLRMLKITTVDDDTEDLPAPNKELEPDPRSLYNIVAEDKATVIGTLNLIDKCFGFAKAKQAMAIAAVALVYSRITPPAAWHRRVVDKILVLGNQLYVECAEEDMLTELKLHHLPAFFTIGPYTIEIYIQPNRHLGQVYRNSADEFKNAIELFFMKNNSAMIEIGHSTIAVWRQRKMFYMFDPYWRNLEGLKEKNGKACVTMSSQLDTLVNMILSNFEEKTTVNFKIHALKILKIHEDPDRAAMIKHNEDLNLVTVDDSQLAIVTGQAEGEDTLTANNQSLIEAGSQLNSIENAAVMGPLMQAAKNRRVTTKRTIVEVRSIVDLSSPTLSMTQVEPPRPQPQQSDLTSLVDDELMAEERMLRQFGEEAGEGFGGEPDDDSMESESEDGLTMAEKEHLRAQKRAAEASDDESGTEKVDKRTGAGARRRPLTAKVLKPTNASKRLKEKKFYKLRRTPADITEMLMSLRPDAEDVTQSRELLKPSNFTTLPDDSQIVYGHKTLTSVGVEDSNHLHPFIAIMACIVGRKYQLYSWSDDIVDYVVTAGTELYKALRVKFEEAPRLEIPRISLGSTDFSAKVTYLMDGQLKQEILEACLENGLFPQCTSGVVVMQNYSCAVFETNHLFYMFDGFGNSRVGLGEGTNDSGVACFFRFKTLKALCGRIIYNKSRRDLLETVSTNRFVVSLVKIGELKPLTSEEKKELKKQTKKHQKKMESEGGIGEDDDCDARMREMREKQQKIREAAKKIGYQEVDGIPLIEGSCALEGPPAPADQIQICHFANISALLMVMDCPLDEWDADRVDYVLEQGQNVYDHADDLEVAEKRTVKNILIDKHYFDVVIRRIKTDANDKYKVLWKALDMVLKFHRYFVVHFSNRSFAVHKGSCGYHLFDPYGSTKSAAKSDETDRDDPLAAQHHLDSDTDSKELDDQAKERKEMREHREKRRRKMQKKDEKERKYKDTSACWREFRTFKALKAHLKVNAEISGPDGCQFFYFDVTSIRKAPRRDTIAFRLKQFRTEKPTLDERFRKPFHEDERWVSVDPVPWSRSTALLPSGRRRNTPGTKWHNWDIEYADDLFSMAGTIHQRSHNFPKEHRDKQTLANLAVAVAMAQIYDISEWNTSVLDSILLNGYEYFKQCWKSSNKADYELQIEDLKKNCEIFPYNVVFEFLPVVEGTIFLLRTMQFNLYKALRFFFDQRDRRFGIVVAKVGEQRRWLAFGKLGEGEYLMYDCQAFGLPMFQDREGTGYVLRATTLHRLLYCMVLTLRCGDFYIYEAKAKIK